MKTFKTKNFRQILEDSRAQAAEVAWARAEQASALRHLMITKQRFAAANRFGKMKEAALARAARLLPEQIKIGIDDEYQVGLLSVRWKGRTRYHLPMDAELEPRCQTSATCGSQALSA